jgi:hypothetical protein
VPESEQDRELKWRQYELLMAREGLELALKANLFYYAVTGGLLSFVLSRPDPTRLPLRLSLLLPLAMGLCFMTVSAMHGGTATVAREEVQRLAHDLGYKAWPDPNTLKAWLWVSAILYGLASSRNHHLLADDDIQVRVLETRMKPARRCSLYCQKYPPEGHVAGLWVHPTRDHHIW